MSINEYKAKRVEERTFTVTYTPKMNTPEKALLVFYNHKGKKHPHDIIKFTKPIELKECCEVKYEANCKRYKWTDLSWTTNLDECEQHFIDWKLMYYPNDVAYNIMVTREKKYVIYYQVVETRQQTLEVVT